MLVVFPPSAFPPLALGFFGLGTGGDWPVGLLFLGLFAVYFFDLFASIGIPLGERGLGLFHLATGGWLMYLTYATTVDLALGYHWRI